MDIEKVGDGLGHFDLLTRLGGCFKLIAFISADAVRDELGDFCPDCLYFLVLELRVDDPVEVLGKGHGV